MEENRGIILDFYNPKNSQLFTENPTNPVISIKILKENGKKIEMKLMTVPFSLNSTLLNKFSFQNNSLKYKNYRNFNINITGINKLEFEDYRKF